MFDTIFSETIFDHNINGSERAIINVNFFDVTSYFQNTSYHQRLSDLHFLFLIRKDTPNRLRIINAIKQLHPSEKAEIFVSNSASYSSR